MVKDNFNWLASSRVPAEGTIGVLRTSKSGSIWSSLPSMGSQTLTDNGDGSSEDVMSESSRISGFRSYSYWINLIPASLAWV